MKVQDLMAILEEYPEDAVVAVDASNVHGTQIVGSVLDTYYHDGCGCFYLRADTSKPIPEGKVMVGYTE